MKSFERPQDNKELEEKAGAWLTRYNQRMDEFLEQEEPSKEELMDILWEHGVLNRIAPLDPDEKQARMKLGKTVWKEDREDPELYWRLLYSAHAVQENQKTGVTTIASGYEYTSGAFQGYHQAMFDEKKGNKIFTGEDKKEGTKILIDELMKRARGELIKRGVTPHENMISLGVTGEWQGVPVTVDRFTHDGLVHFRADDAEGHAALYKHLDEGKAGASPSRIDPDDFKVEEK
jgi:hypothetical protein